MSLTPLDQLPGFRRRFRITPRAGFVRSEVEDDYHHMAVEVQHDGETAKAVDPVMVRAPWTTCPGAVAKLRETFVGIALKAFAGRGEKRENCTHLYDLAILAAAHADDPEVLVYDILVSDAVDGRRGVELRKNGEAVLGWVDSGRTLIEPAELAGVPLDKLRPWIESLDPALREFARVLQWGAMVANGRRRPIANQSDARRLGVGMCYTFQEQRIDSAKRTGAIRDFSDGTTAPLDRIP
jgi:Protein of unknown function (DUF2889)